MANQVPTIEDFYDFEERLFNKLEIVLNNKVSIHSKRWLKSPAVRKMLGNISAGKLQEMRVKKEIPYTKLGTTYFYDYDEIVKLLKKYEIKDKSSLEYK